VKTYWEDLVAQKGWNSYCGSPGQAGEGVLEGPEGQSTFVVKFRVTMNLSKNSENTVIYGSTFLFIVG